jgi:leader peptidase (prepilin peptidase)/N-methyltransferase
VTLGALSWIAIDFGQLLTALGTALATVGMYLLLYLLSRGSLGMGDVKFAFPLGLCVGWYAAEHWLVAIFVSFILAGFVAITGLVFKQMNRKSRLAFGPYMFVGTLLACMVGM